MKQTITYTLAGIALLGLTACASDHVIAKKDGTMITSASEPVVNNQTGMVEYEDAEGRVNQLPLDDVSEIKER